MLNSKVLGLMLLLGPIATMGSWIFYSTDTSDMSFAQEMAALMVDTTKVYVGSGIRMFGLTSMFMGLYFLARSLKSDNTISNTCVEIGSLLLLFAAPVWVLMMGVDMTAVEAAKEFGNETGETILAAGRAFRNVFFFMMIGSILLGISMVLLKQYKGIIGGLFVIIGFVGISNLAPPVAWLGLFGLTSVTGLLTLLKKDN